TKLFPCAVPIPVASIMTASYSRRTDAFTTSLHSGWNNGQWRSTRHTSRFCRGEVRAAAAVHCGAEIHEGSGHPDTRDERRDREEKARRLMQASNLDAILLMEGTSLSYFTGIQWHGGERLFAIVLPAKGMAFYVCPAFEEGRAREQIANAPEGDQGEVRVWQEDESPYQRLAQGFKDRGIATGSIGME